MPRGSMNWEGTEFGRILSRRGISVRMMVNATGFSHKAIERWIKGVNPITSEALKRVSEVLGLAPEDVQDPEVSKAANQGWERGLHFGKAYPELRDARYQEMKKKRKERALLRQSGQDTSSGD